MNVVWIITGYDIILEMCSVHNTFDAYFLLKKEIKRNVFVTVEMCHWYTIFFAKICTCSHISLPLNERALSCVC